MAEASNNSIPQTSIQSDPAKKQVTPERVANLEIAIKDLRAKLEIDFQMEMEGEDCIDIENEDPKAHDHLNELFFMLSRQIAEIEEQASSQEEWIEGLRNAMAQNAEIEELDREEAMTRNQSATAHKKVAKKKDAMTFTIMPEVLLDLLNQVCRDIPKRQRARIQVTLSAEDRNLSIIGNNMAAGISIRVKGQGQCQVGWKRLADVLETFPARTPVSIKCKQDRLQINSFSMEVEGYKPEAIPKDNPIPVVPSLNQHLPIVAAEKKGKNGEPARAIAVDGYSLLPPSPKDNDCTGQPGKVLPADTEAPREPVMCPVCQSVGYFKKREFRGRFYYDHQRSWAVAKDAPGVAVLKGDVATGLCPPCLLKRLQGARHIDPVEGEQADIFEAAPAKVP